MKKIFLSLMVIFALSATANAQVYCDPTFSSGCFSWSNTNIILDSINWSLGSTDCLVSDYTAMSTTLTKGVATPMAVSNGSWCGVGVWMDVNMDGDFDSTENLFYKYNALDTQTYSFNITVPSAVVAGTYRLRVVAGWGTDCYNVSANGYGACGAYQYGNFDDFTINVVDSSSVGMAENKNSAGNNFSVYPNPASDKINVQINKSLIGTAYTITELSGKTILKGMLNSENSSIKLSGLSAGIYFLRVGNSANQILTVTND